MKSTVINTSDHSYNKLKQIFLKTIWILPMLCGCIVTIAQDSLLTKLSKEVDPTEKLDLLKQVIRTNFYNNTDLADSCAHMYMNIAKSMADDSLYFSSIIAQSTIKLVKAEYDSVFYYCKKATDQIGNQRYPLLRAKALHVTALTHYYKGDYDESLKQNFESLKIKESYRKPNLQIKSLSNIAICYERLKDYDNAILYNEKAKSLSPEGDLYSHATIDNNVANIYIIQGKLEEAIPKLKSANKTAITLNNKLLIVDTHLGLAKTYYTLENYNDATIHAEDALTLSMAIDNKVKLLTSLNIAAGIKLKKNDYATALPYLTQALKISNDHNIYENKIDVLNNLSKAYKGLNNYKEYGRVRDSIIELNKYIYQKDKSKITSELNVKYESAKKDITLKENQFKIEKQENQNNLLVLCTVFLLLLAVSIFTYLKNRIKTNKKIALQESKIKSQKIEQLEKENQILSMSSMIEGQESERKRIAQDLHDGLGGLLAAIKVKFGIIQKEIDELESINVYEQTSSMIDDACIEVRKIAHNMMPDALSKLGLIEAVKDISDQQPDIDIKVIDLGIGRLSETQEVMLYRVIQEFLNNTRKHAQASNVIIQFSSNEHEFHIYLEDDGIGFDRKLNSNSKGLGLKSIESRINFLSGRLEIDSIVGEGTTTHIQIPKQ